MNQASGKCAVIIRTDCQMDENRGLLYLTAHDLLLLSLLILILIATKTGLSARAGLSAELSAGS